MNSPATAPLPRVEAERFARTCVHAAGLTRRVEVVVDERARCLVLSGPDQFGLMGTVVYRALRIALPASSRCIALATARHVLSEFHATDDEISARASELPLALAMVLTAP